MTVQRTILSFILALLVICLTALSSQAAQALFSWLPNTEPNLTGYKIHYGTISRNYTIAVDVGLPDEIDGRVQAEIDGLQEGQTYYFAATAYSDAGESDYSTEVAYTVSGTGIPALPVANDIALQGNENTPIAAELDVDNPAGAPLQYTITAQPAHGTLTVEDATGSFTYTPISGYTGIDTFMYTATNSTGVSNIATVTLTILFVNDTPVANNAVILVDEDSSHTGQLSATDSDGDLLTYSLVNLPNKGAASISQSGACTYTPQPGVSGSDSFTYKVSDGTAESNNATVTVTITPINDAPVASAMAITVNENSTHSGQLSATDSDDDLLTYSLVTPPAKGAANVSQDGSCSYTPNPGVFGSDSFTYKVSDGTIESNTATISVTIISVNEAPVVQNTTISINQGSVYNGQLTATDADGDTLTFFMVTEPGNGHLTLTDGGTYTYTPAMDDSTSDSFTFKTSDGYLESNTGTINIIINEGTGDLAFEIGELQVTSDWQSVTFENTFINPAVVAKAGTMNDMEPSTIRIRNLTSSGFDIRIQEWDYLDGVHPAETVVFMVMEQGYHQVNENVLAIAECTDLSGLNSFQDIYFSIPLSRQPVVLASVVTDNEEDAVTLRMQDISTNGFALTLQEQESNDGAHTTETACFIAWEQWSGMLDDLMIEVAATDNILIDSPTLVSFNQEFPATPFTLAGQQSANGMDTAVLGISYLTTTEAGFVVIEETSADSEVGHIPEIGGYIAIAPTSTSLSYEVGEVAVDSTSVRVNFGSPFIEPVVIANSVTRNDNSPSVIRINDVDTEGFNIQVQGYDYLGGSHDVETVSYIVMEKGSYTLDDGTQVEAGLFDTNSTTPTVHSLENQFTIVPVVLTSIITTNDPEAVVGRIRNVATTGFEYQLQEQEANTQYHDQETVAYLAWTPGTGTANGIRFEAGTTLDKVTHKTLAINFNQQFSALPFHFAGMQTTDAGDTATVKIVQAGLTGMDITVEEEASRDRETSHTTEVAGFLILLPE